MCSVAGGKDTAKEAAEPIKIAGDYSNLLVVRITLAVYSRLYR